MDVFYSEIASGVLQIVCALIGILFTAVVLPWVKNELIPWLKDKHLYSVVQKFVQAAEKLAETGAISPDSKKQYVIRLLTRRGYAVSSEVDAFIESAVKELDLAVGAGIEEIVTEFVGEENIEIEDNCGGEGDV